MKCECERRFALWWAPASSRFPAGMTERKTRAKATADLFTPLRLAQAATIFGRTAGAGCTKKGEQIATAFPGWRGYDGGMHRGIGMKDSRSGGARRTENPIAKLAAATQELEPLVLTPREGSLHGGDWFGRFAAQTSMWLGSKWAFAGAGMGIVVWGLTGPVFHYSDTWQLVINTGTTIVTFLMVFLIQNTQNRDALAINLKLNELIRAIDAARDQMINIESLSDIELSEIQANYVKIKDGCGDAGEGTEN